MNKEKNKDVILADTLFEYNPQLGNPLYNNIKAYLESINEISPEEDASIIISLIKEFAEDDNNTESLLAMKKIQELKSEIERLNILTLSVDSYFNE